MIPLQLYQAEHFPKVVEVFKSHFEDGIDIGASVSVIHKDKVILEISGGYSDYENKTLYTKDTLQAVYSSSKAVTTLVIGYLVDQGLLDYNALVTKYWPEFGQNGKDKVTLKDVLGHQAGVPWFEPVLKYEEIIDQEKLRKAIENQSHVFNGEPKRCYHAVTRGFILSEIVSRVDLKRRTVGQILKEEFCDKFNIDFYYGIRDAEKLKRRAVWYEDPASVWQLNKSQSQPNNAANPIDFDVSALPNLVKAVSIALCHDPAEVAANTPDFHVIESVSANGHTTATSLAKLLSQILSDNSPISAATRKLMLDDPLQLKDEATTLDATLTQGGLNQFIYPELNLELYGGAGYGGSVIVLHPESEFTFAYVTNAKQLTLPGSGRGYDLFKAFYEDFGQLNKSLVGKQ